MKKALAISKNIFWGKTHKYIAYILTFKNVYIFLENHLLYKISNYEYLMFLLKKQHYHLERNKINVKGENNSLKRKVILFNFLFALKARCLTILKTNVTCEACRFSFVF